jgi:hypothetical protein
VSRLRSGPLVAWTAAWLAGEVAIDAVLDAVADGDAPHRVAGLPDAEDDVPLLELLAAWRRRSATVCLVLPVAGDVRGLPGPSGFRADALAAGEAVCGAGLGAVPVVTEYGASSAPSTVRWQVFEVDDAPPDYQPLGDAQFELAEAIRDTASALSAADLARWSTSITPESLHDARHAGERLNLPPTFPPRAIALLSQAERLQVALDVAALDPTAGAVDQLGIAARAAALRPLAAAVRRARIAGYNATAG